MNRRNFIKNSASIIAAGSLLEQCSVTPKHPIKGSIVGANSKTGHLLRNAKWQDSSSVTTVDTVIIGGGISGLSAARWLNSNGHENFLLVELDNETGGNAVAGKNNVSAYPWGAHYVPIPNNDLKEYLAFLEEATVITGYDEKKVPIINDYFLCFEPQERLYLNGYWQEGLIPEFGVPKNERLQIKSFMSAMNVFRLAKGSDGKDAFAIPVDNSSEDDIYRHLDNATMKEWMADNGYSSTYLNWYVNYCCRDDYGTDYSRASAWAGIHYFAGRKGVAANAPPQSVITWPEGNSWLAARLRKSFEKKIYTNHLATKIRTDHNGVRVCVVDVETNAVKIIHAKKCIIAVPQFVAVHLLEDADERKKIIADKFNYQPWMVANITAGKMSERDGAALSWDNVLYKGRALGYVEATHQHLQQIEENKVFTYYYPLTEKSATEERQLAYERSFTDWTNIVVDDLSTAHNNVASKIINMDVWVWGHAMISPRPGFIHGLEKKQLQQPINDKIFFAHTDLSGISIFEEAFYQGIKAAQDLLKTV
ncbi:MAG: FAD-dependent oxidoreductase [Ferruginibacter sp.]